MSSVLYRLMDQNLIDHSRDYSCCSITYHDDGSSPTYDTQGGCLCVGGPPFVPEAIQDSPSTCKYVILSVRGLYSKLEDFTVGKWTVSFGTSPGIRDSKEAIQIPLTHSDVVQLLTCCSPPASEREIYRNVCRCQGSFSVLVLHKKFCEKLQVQIKLRAENRQFVPLSIIDITKLQTFPTTYKQAYLKKKKFKLVNKNVPLEGYFVVEGEEKISMLREKVKAHSECIRYGELEELKPSSSGSAILDSTLSYVTGVHNVQHSSVPLIASSYITMGTSVFQMASQLIVQQFEQGGVSLSKRYLPAVLAVIVANVDKVTNIELVQKAYQAMENILTMFTFNVVELRELTLYLHQSGIVDLRWHTNYRVYRVNSGLRLMLTILYKYNDLPIAQSPMDGWEWGDIIPKGMFEDTIVQYGEKLDDCLKRMKESVKEHHDVIMMCLECWNLIVSDSDLAKKKLITPEHQEYLKMLIDNNKLEDYPKLQSCVLRSYILITDYLNKNFIKADDERECLNVQVSNLEHRVLEMSERQVSYTETLLPQSSLELSRSGSSSSSKADGFVVIDVKNHPSCTAAPSTATTATASQRPSHLPCSPTTTTTTATTTATTSTAKLTNQSPPELTASSNVTTSMPHIDRRTSQDLTLPYQSAVAFSEQFVDEHPCQDLLKKVARAVHNSQVTIDALSVELSIPLGDIRNLSADMELWVKIFRLLEGWRDRNALNNTRALAQALHNLGLSCCVEECGMFRRVELVVDYQSAVVSSEQLVNAEDVYTQVSLKSERCEASTMVKQLRILTTLNVSGCNITDQRTDLIVAALLETVLLTNFDLSNTMLNSAKVIKINNALINLSSLKVFNLSNNDIDDRAAESITTVIHNNLLIEKIYLAHNKLLYRGVLNVANALSKETKIKVVDISSNFIASDSIVDLVISLSKCPVLQELYVSQNFLKLVNVLMFAQHFRHHPTLQILDLSGNAISFSSACELIIDITLSVNQALVNLNVGGKDIRPRNIEIYLTPPGEGNKFTLQNLLQCYSFDRMDIPTNFIKVVETCPFSSKDVTSYYVNYLGGIFYNQYHNFAIVIPPGAVSQEEYVEIQATAHHFNPYLIPNGFYPISSCFWISANYEFKVLVYLILNHYAKTNSLKDISNLHVLECRHNCNIINENLMMCEVSDGVYFDIEIGYCVLATKHFCSYCQAKSVKHIPEYLTANYCNYNEPSSGSYIAEVCFCPSNSECIKVITEQCERRNASIENSLIFTISDGEELYVSSIDFSNINSSEWILNQRGKLSITHLCDFEYWRMFHGLTVEQIREREQCFEYPPRLQIKCKQIKPDKPLYSGFKVNKRNKKMEVPIAQFSLIKEVVGQSKPDAFLPNASPQNEIFNDKPEMHDLTKIVIPKVMNEWEYIAEAFRYDLVTIKAIKEKEGNNPKQCCRELFKDWLMTNNGAKVGPKVWSTLLCVLKDVTEIPVDTIEDINSKVNQLN